MQYIYHNQPQTGFYKTEDENLKNHRFVYYFDAIHKMGKEYAILYPTPYSEEISKKILFHGDHFTLGVKKHVPQYHPSFTEEKQLVAFLEQKGLFQYEEQELIFLAIPKEKLLDYYILKNEIHTIQKPILPTFDL